MKVSTTSALNWNHHLMQNLSGKLQETYSHFRKKFGAVLGINPKEVFKCELYIAESKNSYQLYNTLLLRKATDNGGLAGCFWIEQSCIPGATIYKESDELWNLEHEFNHILLHWHAGLTFIYELNRFGKYGSFKWLNEGLSYVLIPNNIIEKTVKNVFIERSIPGIRNIIETASQDYYNSYVFVSYLLNEKKQLLDDLLANIKAGEKALVIKTLEDLPLLQASFSKYVRRTYLGLSEGTWKSTTTKSQLLTAINKQTTPRNPPKSTWKSTTITKPQASEESTALDRTTVGLITAQHAITENLNHSSWTPEEGWDAVKKITYGSTGLFGAAIICLVFGILRITQQKGGNGRGSHNRLRAENRRGHRNEPAKHPETKPLKQEKGKNRFFRNNSNPSQRRQEQY